MYSLEKLLKVSVIGTSFFVPQGVPYGITDRFRFSQMRIGKIKAVFAEPKQVMTTFVGLDEQFSKIRIGTHMPVVLKLNSIMREERDYLIDKGIPFVAGQQVYLPFLGIFMTEQFSQELVMPIKLKPLTQFCALFYIYEKKKELFLTQMTENQEFSSMSMTRAFRELEGTKIFKTQKQGTRKVLFSDLFGRELFEALLPFMKSPVVELGYCKNLIANLPCAGESALANKSMLGMPKQRCFATGNNKVWRDLQIVKKNFGGEYCCVERWSYAPELFGKSRVVDALDLYLSMRNSSDERIQQCLEEMMENFWREYYGSRN